MRDWGEELRMGPLSCAGDRNALGWWKRVKVPLLKKQKQKTVTK